MKNKKTGLPISPLKDSFEERLFANDLPFFDSMVFIVENSTFKKYSFREKRFGINVKPMICCSVEIINYIDYGPLEAERLYKYDETH